MRDVALAAAVSLFAIGCPGDKPPVETPATVEECDPSSSIAEATALRVDGYLNRALAAAERADASCPGPATARQVAEVLADLGLTARASSAYERLAQIGTDEDRAASQTALTELAARPPAVADVPDDDRRTALVLYRDGVSLRHSGEHEQSLRQLRRSYAKSPHPLTIVQIGLTHEAAGDAVEARRAFARALAIAEEIAGEPAVPVIDTGHAERVQSLAYDATGNLVATAGNEGVVKVWNAHTGAQVLSLSPGVTMDAVAIRDDGVLVTVSESAEVMTWNIVDGSQLAVYTLEFDSFVDASIDGEFAVGVGTNGVQVMDTRTGETTMLHGARDIRSVAVGAGGTIAAGSTDGSVAVWANRNSIAKVVHPLSVPVVELAVSPDGQRIAAHSGEPNEDVALWNVVSDHSFGRTIRGGVNDVSDLEFSRDGSLIVVAGERELWVRDADTGAVKAELGVGNVYLSAAEFSPDGTRVAVGTSERVSQIFEIASRSPIHTLGAAGDSGLSLALAPDGEGLAVGGKTIALWSPEHDPPVRILEGHPNWIYGLTFSADGTQLMSGGEDGKVFWWDVATGKRTRKSQNTDRRDIFGLSLSRDGRFLATSGNHMRVYDVKTGRVVHHQERRGAYASFHPTRDVLAVTEGDTVYFLSAPDWKQIDTLSAEGRLDQVVFAGEMMFTLGEAPVFWDLDAKSPVASLAGIGQETLTVVSNADGSRIAAGSEGGLATIWNVDDRSKLRTIVIASNFVGGVAFLPSGALVTSTIEGVVAVWDPETGARIAQMLATRDGQWMISTTDGRIDGAPGPGGGESLVTYRTGRFQLPGFVGWQRDHVPGVLADVLR
jgi:WD40 repeat protein